VTGAANVDPIELLQACLNEKDARLNELRKVMDARLDELRADKDELRADKDELRADMEARLDELRKVMDARLDELRADKEALLAEKDARLQDKSKEVFATLRELSSYRAILEPRMLIELGLNTKYPGAAGGRSPSAKWATFHSEVCTASMDKIELLRKELKCTEAPLLLNSNLEAVYNLLSNKIHGPAITPAGISTGFCCGGDSNSAGCAGAIAIKLLMDDADVQRSLVMPNEVHYLNERYERTHVLRAGKLLQVEQLESGE